MKRIHDETTTPKYKSGKWSWDKKTDSLSFQPHNDLANTEERFIKTNGYKFIRTITQEEEIAFRQEFVRSANTFDSDTVQATDVRDLVLFLMPKEFLTMRFLEFMHKPAVHRLLHALIIYFEYFLRMVELVLIRRDERTGNMAKIQSQQTIEMKRILSVHLSQFRILVARNYSVILKGEGDMAKFYHMRNLSHKSKIATDKSYHKQFLAVATQIVWISMHRRAYYVIEMEMNRLFLTEHFMLQKPEYLKFTPAERSMLYGRSNKIVNYRKQMSPLIQELEHVPVEELPILWIGERKYRGSNLRIAKIELEYIVPDSQLHLIDAAHGILGHPNRFYDTSLNLNWPAIREENFTKEHDPYRILRQPRIRIPNIDKNYREMSKHYEHFFRIFHIYEPVSRQVLTKWLRRDKLIKACVNKEAMDDIYLRCQKELARKPESPNVPQIIHNYFKIVSRFRKDDDYISLGRKHNRKLLTTGGDHFFVD